MKIEEEGEIASAEMMAAIYFHSVRFSLPLLN